VWRGEEERGEDLRMEDAYSSSLLSPSDMSCALERACGCGCGLGCSDGSCGFGNSRWRIAYIVGKSPVGAGG
jgi:hypothetical protein